MFCGCETLREEHSCRVFGKRVLRNKKERLCDDELHDFLLLRCFKDDKVNEDEMRRACGTYRRKVNARKFSVVRRKERYRLEDQGVDVKVLEKLILTKADRRAWTASVCFRKEKIGRFVYTQ